MKRVVVLGATGVLGRAVVGQARAAGHHVVAASRSGDTKVDVRTGEGLTRAFTGAEVVVDATNSQDNAHAVLVAGLRHVLAAARDTNITHFIGTSIVGIDNAPLPYYRTKVAQEQVIVDGPVPWTLLRATQFHDLIPKLARGRIVVAPRGFALQPIDVSEVAALLVAAIDRAPAGRLPDVGGPEVIPFADLVRAWKRAAHVKKLVVPLPVPGATGRWFRSQALCTPEHKVGKRTFAEWLRETYGN